MGTQILWDRSREDIGPESAVLLLLAHFSLVIWNVRVLLFLAPTLTSISQFPSQDTSAKWPLFASFGTFSGFFSPAYCIFKVPNKMLSLFLKAQ